MKKKRKSKLNKLALGGALIVGALFIFYLSGVLFICKQDGGQLVKNNPALILPCFQSGLRQCQAEEYNCEARGPNRPILFWAQRFAKDKLVKLVRGIENIPLFSSTAHAYDQQNTHPALTDEAVDFYNLNFPNNPLTQEDKEMLIRGAIEEDTPPRWLNHFYDPIYNTGWIGYTTSKKWAISSTTQQAFTDSAFSYGGFANLFSDGLSPTDYSYERALHDYATGNRKRAMLAMGHVMHLLEDSNVPEHTRGDTHLPWHGTESPYEKTMAKWNPGNIDVASGLFKKSKKPVLLSQIGDYFDEIARYSNGYFFSEDTIISTKYQLPQIIETQRTKSEEKLFAIGLDKNRQKFNLAILNTRKVRNVFQISRATLLDEEFGDIILDDYWSRLSTDFVAHGAGALKLFLEQAEQVKREYAKNSEIIAQTGLFNKFMGFLGFSGSSQPRFVFVPKLIEAIISQPLVLGESANDACPVTDEDCNGVSNDVNRANNRVNDVSNDASNRANRANDVGTVSTPSPTPLDSQNLTGQAPLPTSVTYGGSSGGSGGSSDIVTPTPTPTPTPSSTPTPSPSPTPSPTSSSTPSPTLTPTPLPSPTPTPSPIGKVVINEIAWMGTGSTGGLANDEWLELYNPSSMSVNISGWRLRSLTDDSPNITIAATKSIEPFGFFLLERTNDAPISDISADQIYTGNLKDREDNGKGGETLELRDNNDNLVDLVPASGSWFAGLKNSRFTMERIDPLKPGADASNWANNNGVIRNGTNAAGEPINGTPRARNSIYANKPPSAVLDLLVDTASSFFAKIWLVWSAPKDDDDPPSKLAYDLRYATRSFDTMTDWDVAVKVAASSMPTAIAPFASPQSASFSIFDYNKDYYFAIKTTDGMGWSDISNQPKYTIKPAISSGSTTFRGPAGPATISWRFPVPDAFYLNQPAIAPDGTVYFGAPNDMTGNPRLYAVGSDGVKKWHHDNEIAGFGVPTTPAVSDDGAVYFGHLSSWVTALNANGTLWWQYDTSRVNGVGVDEDGNVYATSDNRMINKIGPDGNEVWRVQNSYAFGFTPVAISGDKDIYLTTNSAGLPEFYRLGSNDGSVVWQNRISDSYQYQAFDLAYDEETDKFYTATTAGHIVSVNRLDGAIESHRFAFGVPATSKVVVFEDILIVGVDFSLQNPASGQAVIALNKANKSVIWTFPVDSRVNKQIAVDTDQNLYFATHSGKVYSIDKNGQERWEIDIGAATDTYPILGNNAVFIGAGGELFKLAD